MYGLLSGMEFALFDHSEVILAARIAGSKTVPTECFEWSEPFVARLARRILIQLDCKTRAI